MAFVRREQGAAAHGALFLCDASHPESLRLSTIENMARGWESKSVEEQQSELGRQSGNGSKRSAEETRKRNKRRELELKRSRVLDQISRSQNERYGDLLKRELEFLEAELAKL